MTGSEGRAPIFRKGSIVVQESSPDVLGEVIADPDWDSNEWWYEVRFVKQEKCLAEYELICPPSRLEGVVDLAGQGRWGTFETLLRAVAVERILKHNRSTVYAFNASRIQFMPHQYRPLLKVLDSEDRRLLIADEVGLGKTIEAGLVLAELQARQKLDRVLVLVPSRLRGKWQAEMQRKFRLDFEIWGGQQIREYAERMERWNRSPGFRAIVSMQTLRSRKALDAFLGAVPSLDLLIMDEAHHARNRSTATSAMVEELSDIADGFLMLSATPLHLGTGDLFNLLRLLRRHEFEDEIAFQQSLLRNEGVVRAQSAARAQDKARLDGAAGLIRKLNGIKEGQPSGDPMMDEALGLMAGKLSTREDWAVLERQLENAHVLSHIFSRTKKRDVDEHTAKRDGYWIPVEWTEEEDQAYLGLAGIDPAERVPGGRLSLGQIQRARQAASSVHGTLLFRNTGLNDLDELSDLEDGRSYDRLPVTLLDPRLPAVDSKYLMLKEVLGRIWEEDPSRKVLVFTFFVGTSRYLQTRLAKDGIMAGRIAGDVPSRPREPARDERAIVIRNFRVRPETRVLVSTEVGSEGLDFQFCSAVVNYDLPWNPMLVEQRIGRVDRFGQKADKVGIYSLVVRNTIEDRILERLYTRIGIFEGSIGDLETIVGDELNILRRDYFSGELSSLELEQKAEQAARVIAARAREAKELEHRAEKLVGHEDFIREEVGKVRRLGRFLTPGQIRALVEGYLERHHPDVRLQKPEPGVWRMKLTNRLATEIDLSADDGERWSAELFQRTRDGFLRLTTDGDLAFKDESLDLLNATHPLVRTAALQLEPLLEEPSARVGAIRLSLPEDHGGVAYPGCYWLAVIAMEISGLQTRRSLEAFMVREGCAEVVGGDDAERFAYLSLEHGAPHPSPGSLPPFPEEVWRSVLSAARSRKLEAQKREDRENRSLLERRRRRFEDERTRKIASAKRRISTLEERGRSERAVQLSRDQLNSIEVDFEKRRRALESGEKVGVDLILPPVICCAVEVF